MTRPYTFHVTVDASAHWNILNAADALERAANQAAFAADIQTLSWPTAAEKRGAFFYALRMVDDARRHLTLGNAL